jgi:hypothetical protein
MKITLPKLDHFLHRVFIECARGFWKAPFLFLESVPMIEKQKNVLQMESMCIEALSGAVRSLLPVKSILNEYLAEDEDEGDAEDEPEDVKEEVKEEVKLKKKKASLPILSTISSYTTTVLPSPMTDVVPSTITTVIPSTITEIAPSTITEIAPSTITEVAPAIAAIPPSLLIKEDHSAVLPPERDGITAMKIDTEPSVHFTPYDTVYDETKDSISEIRYSPKISVEDKPESHWGEDEPLQRIEISDTGSSLSMEDMEDLEAPANSPIVPSVDPSEEEIPLTASGEFEELG